MPWQAWLIVAVWIVGWFGSVVLNEPEDAAEGAFLLFACSFTWPLLALGWIVSRPWS